MRAGDARKTARDLPVVTSKKVCGTLARRANHVATRDCQPHEIAGPASLRPLDAQKRKWKRRALIHLNTPSGHAACRANAGSPRLRHRGSRAAIRVTQRATCHISISRSFRRLYASSIASVSLWQTTRTVAPLIMSVPLMTGTRRYSPMGAIHDPTVQFCEINYGNRDKSSRFSPR